jgi:flavin-dependent dehydrogenase
MHVRHGHYIGVAPLPGGLANTCLVLPAGRPAPGWRDPASMIGARLAADPVLGPRYVQAEMVQAPTVLGPMAVDACGAGVDGLLLAGDAAGFIDPMTGDGLTFALRGAELAAETTLDVFAGAIAPQDAPRVLHERRERAFRWKWRFNRTLRTLVASPASINRAAMAARILPPVFETMIRYAGDVRRQ